MKIHPRYQLEQEATREIEDAVVAAVKKHGLTFGELWRIFTRIESRWSVYAVRQERDQERADEDPDDTEERVPIDSDDMD